MIAQIKKIHLIFEFIICPASGTNHDNPASRIVIRFDFVNLKIKIMFTRRVVPFKNRESYQIKEGIVRDWSDMEKFFNSATVSCEDKPFTKDDMVDIMSKTYNQCPALYIAVMEEKTKW